MTEVEKKCGICGEELVCDGTFWVCNGKIETSDDLLKAFSGEKMAHAPYRITPKLFRDNNRPQIEPQSKE